MLPEMTKEERAARMTEKRDKIIQFLASGEVFTTTAVVCELLGCSQPVAHRTLEALVKDEQLKTEAVTIDGHKTRLWGITPHGLGLAGSFQVPYFELGRTNPAYVPHHTDTQRARLKAQAAGWKAWTPGKALYGQGLKKIPDALAVDPQGELVAIELERTLKTPKRYADIVSQHLQTIKTGKWARVLYLTPARIPAQALRTAVHRVIEVSVAGEKVRLEPRHYERFSFFDLETWKGEAS